MKFYQEQIELIHFVTYYVALHFIKRMRIFHIRVLLDSSQDVFRDIEIEEKSTFLDLHNAIIESFKFSGMEMASFYKSNEYWDKGEEIALIDMMNDPKIDVRIFLNHITCGEITLHVIINQ